MRFLFGVLFSLVTIYIGYSMAGGERHLLWQPAELLIVVGAALGSAIVSSPFNVLYGSIKDAKKLFINTLPNKKDYQEILALLFNLFRFGKSKGIVELEKHISDPYSSQIFTIAPFVLKDDSTRNFIIDGLRLITMGVQQSSMLQTFIKKQIKIYEEEHDNYHGFFLQLGDSLPAIGIVAAVLGVIVAMKVIAGDPGQLGQKIAAALIGTFLGIMISYTIVTPIGQFLATHAQKKVQLWHCIRIGIVGYSDGISATIILEIMRQSITEDVRPTFEEMENVIREKQIKIS